MADTDWTLPSSNMLHQLTAMFSLAGLLSTFTKKCVIQSHQSKLPHFLQTTVYNIHLLTTMSC